MTRIAIDMNVRVRGNLTYSGFEDIEGDMAVEGAPVEVYEPESGIAGTGRIVELDRERELVYLEVDWAGLLAPSPRVGNTVRLLGEHGWVAVIDTNLYNLANVDSTTQRRIATRPESAPVAAAVEPNVDRGGRGLTYG